MLCVPEDNVPVVNDQDVVPVAFETGPESTFHVIDNTAILSEAPPETDTVVEKVDVWFGGDDIVRVGGTVSVRVKVIMRSDDVKLFHTEL